MSYRLRFHPDLKADLTALPKHLRTSILNDHFPRLQRNPNLGKPLTGILAGIYSYSITFPGAQYRIAYRIIETDQVIFVLMVSKRERFYDRLRQRITP
jgi:mRNA-degrading endonuclease RelE of RelBE toxin-antitoxin system